MKIHSKKISIIGIGVTGLAVAEKLSGLGEHVFLSEKKNKHEIEKKLLQKISALHIDTEFGRHSKEILENAKLIVVSPGVDLEQEIFRKALRKKIRIVSEIELASLFIKKPIIAITGTNGKTTTVSLTASILNDSGLKTVAAGNIGYPLIKVNDSKLDYIVAEISSYQLEAISKFRPWISVILNITEDHILRHRSMSNYANSKARIFENQGAGDYLIYNHDDLTVRRISSVAKCRKIPFSVEHVLPNGVYINKGKIISQIFDNKEAICGTSQVYIKGIHNLQNSLAAVAASIICGVKKKDIIRTLKTFKGVEHRIEYVKKVRGVSFYNDSKGTNPDSTVMAINAIFPENEIILILGGRDKKTSLRTLSELIKDKVKGVVLMGEAAQRFKKNLEGVGYKKISFAKSMDGAVMESFRLASSGDAVLLSPACASFDMFSNYEERGRVFKKIVNKMQRKFNGTAR